MHYLTVTLLLIDYTSTHTEHGLGVTLHAHRLTHLTVGPWADQAYIEGLCQQNLRHIVSKFINQLQISLIHDIQFKDTKLNWATCQRGPEGVTTGGSLPPTG